MEPTLRESGHAVEKKQHHNGLRLFGVEEAVPYLQIGSEQGDKGDITATVVTADNMHQPQSVNLTAWIEELQGKGSITPAGMVAQVLG